MITNTYTPHVGGVARSVEAFTKEYRRLGHEVLVVAPEFPNVPKDETGVLRVPAIQRFNGSDFSVRIPTPKSLSMELTKFNPDVVHSHHPFLLGDTAFRVAHKSRVPLVFTHHTMYEEYTHYVPGDSPVMKRFAINLSVGYCNLCDHVIAPSDSVAEILRERGVKAGIEVIPTGVALDRFAKGSGSGFRGVFDLPPKAFVVGHVGRLAPEKNLTFLAEAVAAFIKREPRGHFMVVGQGPSTDDISKIFDREGLKDRLHLMGTMDGPVLVSAYRAMDVFAFASRSETQGMVLIEAMAADVPVVALDAPGAREVVKDGINGCLLKNQNLTDFTNALHWMAALPADAKKKMKAAVRKTAKENSIERCAARALQLYESLRSKEFVDREAEVSTWSSVVETLKTEWNLFANLAEAAGSAFSESPSAGRSA